MAIIDSELHLYLGAVSENPSANGGRMTTTRVVSGVVNNALPNIGYAERTEGGRVRRKAFFKVANDADLTALSPRIWLDKPTAGGEYVFFYPATQRNVEADLTGSERKYGAAYLASNANAGSSTLVVTLENAALAGIFQDGDTIRITDKVNAGSATGNEEFRTIDGAPVVDGLTVTITLESALSNSYATSSGSRVSTVHEPASVACAVDNWVETLGGTYDETTYPVLGDNIGTIEQTWTLTFTSTTAFTVSGDTVGVVGTGNVSTDFAPTNSAYGKPFFTLRAAGWAGTQAIGNTLVYQTHPAAVPLFVDRVTPAGTGEIASSIASLVMFCESAG